MRWLFRLALVLTAAALFGLDVQAQDGANQPLVFSYRDANGPGRLSVLDLGPGRDTDVHFVKVTLSQNGVESTGSGITRQLEPQMPFRTLIAFSLARRRGPTLFYEGTTISGITVSGQGTFHALGLPERRTDWSIVLGGATTSGVRGVATAGPISPVERPGVPNTRPLSNALITVQPAGGGQEIARTRTGRDGRFEIALSPGTYLLVPLPPEPAARLPRAEPRTVRVQEGKFTEVVVEYDTGIR
jgi:hypothetical protein